VGAASAGQGAASAGTGSCLCWHRELPLLDRELPLLAQGTSSAETGDFLSHYEFVESDWNCLNDAGWARRLQEDPPPRPVWTSSFLPLNGLEGIYLPMMLRDY